MADWLLTRFYGAVMREGLEKRDVPDIDSQEFVHFAAAFGFNAVERAKLRHAIRTGQEASGAPGAASEPAPRRSSRSPLPRRGSAWVRHGGDRRRAYDDAQPEPDAGSSASGQYLPFDRRRSRSRSRDGGPRDSHHEPRGPPARQHAHSHSQQQPPPPQQRTRLPSPPPQARGVAQERASLRQPPPAPPPVPRQDARRGWGGGSGDGAPKHGSVGAATARRGGRSSKANIGRVKEEEEEELLDYSDGHLKEEPMSNDEGEHPPHTAQLGGPLSDVDLSNPRVRAGLKCATPECNFLVHRSPEFGGFCCRKCEWVYSVGSCSKKTKKHGPLCERRDAPSSAAVAPAVGADAWSEEGGAEGGGHGGGRAARAGRRAEASSPPPSPPQPPPTADEPWKLEPPVELDEGVVVWLRELRMVEFTEALTQLGIEKLEDLPFVSSEDLKAMGLSVPQQRKFRQGVEALRTTLNLPRVRRQGAIHRPPPL